jgi:peptide/nickel transport system permease protein
MTPALKSGLALALLLLLASLAGPWLIAWEPSATDLAGRLAPPSAAHWLGTDELGRDILARILEGGRTTLATALLVAGFAGPCGLFFGTLSGLLGGWADVLLMRLVDIALAFPRLILALALAAALGPGLLNAALAVALTAWPAYARLARAETLRIKDADFIAAGRMAGAGTARLVLVHAMPLGLSTMMVRMSLDLAGIILTVAGLGFLGLGAPPPAPEWGQMVAAGRKFLLDQWWVAGFPGLAILLAALAFNLLGEGLRDLLDPRRAVHAA